MDTEFLQYVASACTLADRYLDLMEGVCQRGEKKLPKELETYKKLRKKFGEQNNG